MFREFYLLLLFLLTACTNTFMNTNDKEDLRTAEEIAQANVVKHLKNPIHLNDISGYTPVAFSVLDTLAGYRNEEKPIAFTIEHTYKGLDVLNVEVTREVIIYFNKELEVLKVESK